ncbi:hypothetical protein GQ457_12G032130 [Hibiscus cannabinus]
MLVLNERQLDAVVLSCYCISYIKDIFECREGSGLSSSSAQYGYKQQLSETEQKYNETTSTLLGLIDGLIANVKSKDTGLRDRELRYNVIVRQLTDENATMLHKASRDFQSMSYAVDARSMTGGNIVTLFVSNLPTNLHWSGLRQAFGRHGDLVDSFIAKKRDKAGRRFGFVRFANRIDAYRAIERLDGFRLYGFRLEVSFARFNNRTSYWRKVRNVPKSDEKEKKSSGQREKEHEVKNQKHKEVLEDRGDCSNSFSESLIRILGHVDEEALRRLERCVIGTSSTVCSSETIKTRLHNWDWENFL